MAQNTKVSTGRSYVITLIKTSVSFKETYNLCERKNVPRSCVWMWMWMFPLRAISFSRFAHSEQSTIVFKGENDRGKRQIWESELTVFKDMK